MSALVLRRSIVLLAITACDSPAEVAAPPREPIYAPSLAAWSLGTVTATIGRGQAPQVALREAVVGAVDGPLRLPTPWAVPGDGPARAIVYGTAAGKHAIELIEIDRGRIVWRDTTGCGGPVVGVTEEVVVCADGRGTRAIGLDGKRRWNTDGATFIAMTGERVVIAGVGEAVIVDADLGHELARVKLPSIAAVTGPPASLGRLASSSPPGAIASDSILASCGDAGRELFAYGQDGKLVRIAEAPVGPKVVWSVPLDTIAGIEACDGASVVVTVSTATGTSLVALARETGQVTGKVEAVRGYWPARDGSDRLEVSTAGGVARWSRDLASSREHVAVPSLGELLAKRGALRLVRATPSTAALLDEAGVRAYVPLAHLGAVLGERAIIAASWLGSPGETVHRIGIPDDYRRRLRVVDPRPGVAVPAELRDLPALADVDTGGAVARPGAGTHAVAAVALDPRDPHVFYVVEQNSAPDDDAPSGVGRFDLRARTWTWHRAGGCGAGVPVGLAASRELVACAARGGERASVRATARDGAPRWEWTGENVDAVAAAGDVVALFDADRLVVLDARDGQPLATFASDDGAAMRATLLDVAGMTLLVTAERDRVVARMPRVRMTPAWSLAVAGVVRSLAPAGDGVLIALEDGDAYRADARTGTTVAVPGIDLVWRASGELVTGEAPGGPIPPARPYVPPAPKLPPRRGPVPERDPEAPPALPKPWPPPAAMPPSWQYTLYELTGALRARNDFALAAPLVPAQARAAGAPLLVQSGPGLREVLVLDPKRGDPLRRVRLPDEAAAGMAFSTMVDGQPVVGTLLANPLRVVLF